MAGGRVLGRTLARTDLAGPFAWSGPSGADDADCWLVSCIEEWDDAKTGFITLPLQVCYLGSAVPL